MWKSLIKFILGAVIEKIVEDKIAAKSSGER